MGKKGIIYQHEDSTRTELFTACSICNTLAPLGQHKAWNEVRRPEGRNKDKG